MREWTSYEECMANELAEEATGSSWELFSVSEKAVWIRAWRYVRDEWGMRLREDDSNV